MIDETTLMILKAARQQEAARLRSDAESVIYVCATVWNTPGAERMLYIAELLETAQ